MSPFQPTDAADLLREVEARALGHVALGAFDWEGRLRAKHYSTSLLRDALAHGLAMTTAIFAQDPADEPILFGPFEDAAKGYPDGTLALDPASARDAPFEAGGQGLLVLGQFAAPYAEYCPRALLARELARLHALGYSVRGGYEIEFRLLADTVRELAGKSADQLSLAPGFERMYSMVDQSAAANFLHDLERLSASLRVPLAVVHHEFKGLIEAALAREQGLAIADSAALFRTVAAIVAQRDARLACFMARVSARHQSAGAHLNLSLCSRDGEDDSGNCFHDAHGPAGMSALMQAFLGGLQRYVPELFLLFAPNVNSYKRFAPSCIAPRTNSWGINNKTVAFRAVTVDPMHTRIEIRVPGADVNPHLALAAAVAAGRMGLTQGLQPGARCDGDANAPGAPVAAPFPRELRAAIAGWRGSALARDAFGPGFVDAYARSREWQQCKFDAAVTDWELQTYARNV